MRNAKNMALCGVFTALIAIGAFIRIPVPVVPFTLQYLFTMLAGLLLGAKLGAAAVALYVGMGLIGFPIFTQGGGFGYVFNPLSRGLYCGSLCHGKNSAYGGTATIRASVGGESDRTFHRVRLWHGALLSDS